MTEPAKSNDVDASWDGTGSLDDHRQKAFSQIEQPGFGSGASKPPVPVSKHGNKQNNSEVKDTSDGK